MLHRKRKVQSGFNKRNAIGRIQMR